MAAGWARVMLALGATGVLACSAPAAAGWRLVPAGQTVTIGRLGVTAPSDWNAETAAAPGTATWTHDGLALNVIDLAVARAGQPLYRQRRHRRHRPAGPPVPVGLALVDLAELFESSFRAGTALTDFAIERAAPARLGGQPAVELAFRFSLPDDPLDRRGLARLAVVDGAVYAITFSAPALHFFDAGVGEARAIMDGARFLAVTGRSG